MDNPKKSTTPRSSKRSTTNLADLRLTPLSAKFTESSINTSNEDPSEASFARSHSSYIQGKSAPTSPGILSRNSSRKLLGAGLSRRGELYDNDFSAPLNKYTYGGVVVRDEDGNTRFNVTAADIPKAKSDAALLVQRSKEAALGVPSKRKKQYQARSRTGGTVTPRVKNKAVAVEEDWLTRTGATATALVQESKGQSWLASRDSSNSLIHVQDTSDDEDEGYEELAAQSTHASRRQLIDEEPSPVSTRASQWGSRYGSRTASRRTSRRGSVTTGSRTPLAAPGGRETSTSYFDLVDPSELPLEPDYADPEDDPDPQTEEAVARLTENRSFGLGGLVDRLMNFNLFKVEEKEESSEGEVEPSVETEAQAKERIAAENKRKREEKEKLVNRPAPREGEEADAQGEGGWSDAAWLLSVASKAIF